MISMAVSLALASLGFASVSDEEPILEEAWFQKFEEANRLRAELNIRPLTPKERMNILLGQFFPPWCGVSLRESVPTLIAAFVPEYKGKGRLKTWFWKEIGRQEIPESTWKNFEGLKGLPSWMSSTDLHKMNGVIGERAKKMYVSWLGIHVRNGDPMDTEIELPLIIGEGKASR
jgi:hypothetical protein